jgi:uncharacterized membrane protein
MPTIAAFDALEVAHPAWLWLLLLLAPMAWWHAHSQAGLPRWRHRAVGALRLVIMLALVLALAGLRWLVPTQRLCVIFAVDGSLSVADESRDFSRTFINDSTTRARPNDEVGVLLFGREAFFEQAPAPPHRLPPFTTTVPRDYTDIAQALRLAQASLTPGARARIVLFSDGNENLGDASAEASMAAERGVEIWTVPLPRPAQKEVLVDRLEVPASTRQDEPFELRAVVRSTYATPAELLLSRNGLALGSLPVQLHPGENVFFLPQRSTRGGSYEYEVTVHAPHDGIADNNTASTLTFTRGRPRVLYAHGGGEAPGFLPSMLRAQGIEVDVVSGRQFPTSMAALQGYTSIVLSNLPAAEVSRSQLRLLAAWVKDFGGGLMMLGSPQSFGAGGYYATPLADVLPVDLDVRKSKHLPSVAMALAIDKSGSMDETIGGVTKIGVAREAAIATLSLLAPTDSMGVVAFDSAAKWVVPMQTADNREAMIGDVASLRAGGGTDMYPAIDAALAALKNVNAATKHIILLSDGMTAPRDFDGLMREVRAAKITLTTIGVGTDTDKHFMQTLADKGGGRFYYTEQADVIPSLFTREAILASRSAVVDKTFAPSAAGTHPMLRGVTALPPLDGYAVTTPRHGAQTPLLAIDGDPLLAAWRIGLGKTVAFTSDDGARWARHWAGSAQAAALLVQATRWTFSEVEPAPFRVTSRRQGAAVHLEVEAGNDGHFENFLALEGVAVGPGGAETPLAFSQTGPGRYRASFDLQGTGAWSVLVRDQKSGRAQRLPLVFPYSPEYRDLQNDTVLLERLATLSGGRFNPAPADIFTPPARAAYNATDAWQSLVWLALLLLPIEVALRRIFLPRRGLRSVPAFASQGAAATTTAATSALEKLKARQRAVHEQLGPTRDAPAASGPARAEPSATHPASGETKDRSKAASSAPSSADHEPAPADSPRRSTLEQLKKARRK